MLMSVINLVGCPLRKHIHLRLWGSACSLNSSLVAESVCLCEFNKSDLFLLYTSLASKKSTSSWKPCWIPGLSLEKLAIWMNSCLWSQLSSTPNHILCFIMRCVRAILEYNSVILYERVRSRNIHSPPPPSLNPARLITARWIRGRLDQLNLFDCPDGIHAWLVLLQYKEPDSRR